MRRDLEIFTTVFALSLTALTPALAQGELTQLIANAGLTPAEAEGLSLEQIAIYKFNHDSRRDDAISVGARNDPVLVDTRAYAQLIASAGLTPAEAQDMTLREIFAHKLDRDNSEDLHLPKAGAPAVVDPSAHAQLVRSVGLSPEEAAGIPLSSVVLIKFQSQSD